MGRRFPRDFRPSVEEVDRRELLSAITDIMVANSLAQGRKAASTIADALSSQSIAVPANQGPQGPNLALAPTGTLTARQQKKERFTAHYVGTYTVGGGRTSTEATQTYITASGSANTMLHSDIQLLLITPTNPTATLGNTGVASIFDRNLNSNTALGFDLASPAADVDRAGRPNLFTNVTIDANISAGLYVEGYSVGNINIRYVPSGKHTKGVISQGKAIVTIHAQIYTAGTSFILHNSNIDP